MVKSCLNKLEIEVVALAMKEELSKKKIAAKYL
jgi:hypothetical protein